MDKIPNQIEHLKRSGLVTKRLGPDFQKRVGAVIVLIPITWFAASIGLIPSMGLAALAHTLWVFPLFPLGLTLGLPWSLVPALYASQFSWLIWMTYIGLAAGVILSGTRRVARTVYILLVILLLLNAYGCNRLLVSG